MLNENGEFDEAKVYGMIVNRDSFFYSYLVYSLCMFGMVVGLSIGKKLLSMGPLFSQEDITSNITSPRFVYLLSSSLYVLSLLSFTLVDKYECCANMNN